MPTTSTNLESEIPISQSVDTENLVSEEVGATEAPLIQDSGPVDTEKQLTMNQSEDISLLNVDDVVRNVTGDIQMDAQHIEITEELFMEEIIVDKDPDSPIMGDIHSILALETTLTTTTSLFTPTEEFIIEEVISAGFLVQPTVNEPTDSSVKQQVQENEPNIIIADVVEPSVTTQSVEIPLLEQPSSSGKEISMITLDSPMDLPDKSTLDGVLSSLNTMTASIRSISTIQEVHGVSHANFKKKVLEQLSTVRSDITSLILSLDTIKRTQKVAVSSSQSLTEILDMVNDHLVSKIEFVHTQLSGKIDIIFSQLSMTLRNLEHLPGDQAVDTKGEEDQAKHKEQKETDKDQA